MNHAPYTTATGHRACDICPSRRLPGGHFDVLPRPSRTAPFDSATGQRFTADGTPVCVHPDRIGLPPAPYASSNAPLPWQTPPPQQPEALIQWIRDAVVSAPQDAVDDVIERACAALRETDAQADVTTVLRAALSG